MYLDYFSHYVQIYFVIMCRFIFHDFMIELSKKIVL